ncbi:MAG: hypothetical protein ACM3SY_05025 [Candidatus Omnitrophota bacterium]
MGNPFVLTVQLKQHSPLIHFQSDQPGATLRATELKPKLDKFLIAHTFKDNFEEYKRFLVEYDEKKYLQLKGNEKKDYEERIHKALDYKVKIRVDPGKVRTESFSIITMKKTGVRYPLLTLEIFSLKPGLLDKIKEVIDDFFILHNFGLRQSKGFGCFTTSDTTQDGFEKTALIKYPVFYKKRTTVPNVFSEIDMDYKILKSGNNHNQYLKSELFRYFCGQGQIAWEKRKIKETLKAKYPGVFNSLMHRGENKGNRIATCDSDKKDPDYRYIRALLGLAEHNEFRTWQGKIQITIEDHKEEIERFQSPLMFKVFNQTIYIFPNEIPDAMFNRNFNFLLDDNNLFTIPTPKKDQFSMIEFLDFSLFKELKGWERIPKK